MITWINTLFKKKKNPNQRCLEPNSGYWLDCKIMFEKSCQSFPAHFLAKNTEIMNVIFIFLRRNTSMKTWLNSWKNLVSSYCTFCFILLHYGDNLQTVLNGLVIVEEWGGCFWKRFNYLGSVVVIHCGKTCCSLTKIVVVGLSVLIAVIVLKGMWRVW